MSFSKPLPPFTYDVLYYLNRNQLERFSIVCRSLKNIIDRYFHTKPYRVFDNLDIYGGSYYLHHNRAQWHPDREDYSVQQFLAGRKSKSKRFVDDYIHYSLADMRPYLGPTVRIKCTDIYVGVDIIAAYNIAEMESIAYLWREGKIGIRSAKSYGSSHVVAEDFQPILNSPIILQCRYLDMENAHFSFKDCKALYTVKVLESCFEERYREDEIELWHQYWQQFLEQPGAKPVVVFRSVCYKYFDNFLDQLSKNFSSAISPNTFKIALFHYKKSLTEFRETNNALGEILELKKGLPVEYLKEYTYRNGYEICHNYTLERSSI